MRLEPPDVFTVGYERRTVDELIEMLRLVGVTRLVDVRDHPWSRRAGFSKRPLAEALEGAGIAYVHAKALGNPRANRDRYRSGEREEGAEVFRRHLHEAGAAALRDLAADLDANPGEVCLLCYERDHRVCHRDVIANELRAMRPDMDVEHL